MAIRYCFLVVILSSNILSVVSYYFFRENNMSRGWVENSIESVEEVDGKGGREYFLTVQCDFIRLLISE
jgi:hypothetical protein